MTKSLLPLLVFAWVHAEAPRPRPGFEGINVRLTAATASSSSEAQDRSTGLEVTGNFALTQLGTWKFGMIGLMPPSTSLRSAAFH